MISERINEIWIEGPDSARGVIDEVFKEDPYHMADMVPEGSVVLDIGAHVGCFTLRCAVERRCSRVTAIEPNPVSFAWLTHNVGKVRAGHIRTINGAAGATSGTRIFCCDLAHPPSSRFERPPENRPCAEVPVRTFTLHELVDLSGGRVDVLKLDCEGAEREILLSSPESLHSVDVVVMEWHNYDGHVYRDHLASLGFSVTLMGGGVPQPQYHPSMAGGMLYARRPS